MNISLLNIILHQGYHNEQINLLKYTQKSTKYFNIKLLLNKYLEFRDLQIFSTVHLFI